MHAHTHHHAHDHAHHDHHAPESFNSAFLLAVSFNFLFVLIEVFYSYRAHSMSLIADAAHNLGDVLALSFAWGANILLSKQAKQAYSYGYKRATILASMLNALILVVGSVFIACASIDKLAHASQVDGGLMSLVALFGILINGGTALLFVHGAHSDLNMKGAFLHLLYDALISAGVVVSGVLIYYTHQMWIDPIVGLVVVVIVLWGTWGLLRDSINLILDATPAHIDFDEVKHVLQHLPNVVAVHDLHIWGLSTKQTALTVHLVFAQRAEVQVDYHEINKKLKEKFNIDHVTIQVEVNDSDFVCIRSERCC
jgi:cobalt-zinc-cadmium efflux system protein